MSRASLRPIEMSFSYHKIELAAKFTHPIIKYMSVLIDSTPLNPSSPLRNAYNMSTLISAGRFGKLLAAMLPASCSNRFADCACSWLRGEPSISNGLNRAKHPAGLKPAGCFALFIYVFISDRVRSSSMINRPDACAV